MPKSFAFDAGYYNQYYSDKATCVADQRSINKLGNFVASYLKFLDVPVLSVLDLGCGLGLWESVIRRHYPKAEYHGVELSEYLCRKLGWQHGSVIDYDDQGQHDLVVCQGVFQYLNARDCKKAIRNLARRSRAAVYLQALTKNDWAENADQSVTDGEVYLRSSEWYQECLSQYLVSIGGGMFLKRGTDVVLFDFERLAR